MRFGTQARLLFAGLLMMWLASIAQEPGGLPAFASELDVAVTDLGALARDASAALASEEDGHVIAYPDGVVCERDAQTGVVRLDECVSPPADRTE